MASNPKKGFADKKMIGRAISDSFIKLNPKTQAQNPVMLLVYISAILTTIPQCVLGGAVVSVFASIAMTGIRLLVTEKLTARNATVAGLSIAIGMGVSLSGGCLDQMTQSIHSALNLSMNLENFQAIINNTFASSPVVLATIFAVILNLILPKEKTTEKETKLR